MNPDIKVEDQDVKNGQEPHIKSELEGISPAPQEDDDIYEDAGDLDFAGSEESALFLARVPKFLWDSWLALDDNQEIQIGTVRVEGGPSDIKKMSLMLSTNVPPNQKIPVPREYSMQIIDPDAANTFVFTEKDLPGYRKYTHDRAPPRFKDRKRVEKSQKPETNIRRAIPKQTNLVGKVHTEISCLPIENRDYQRYTDEKARREMKPKSKIQVLPGVPQGNLLAPGTLGVGQDLKGFISMTGKTKGRKNEYKAARMPQNELLDLIYDLFSTYQYYRLSTLKEKTNQPEAYLKETLDKVAMLVKTGTHANTYQLRPEATEGQYANAGLFDNVKAEAAPDVGQDGRGHINGIVDGDDEDVKMEDVTFR